MTAQPLTGSQDAGMYTRSELRGFWDNILINVASRTALKNFSQNLIIYSTSQEGSDGFQSYTLRNEFYVDKMISPEYFKDRVVDTLGPVGYIFEHCGVYFSVSLFLKPITDLIVLIIKHMEINRMTSASLGFGKTLLSVSYNIFLTPVMTSMYNPKASGLASDAPRKVDPGVDIELYGMREDAKKKEEHLYPVVNSAALGFSTLPVSPVYYSNNTSYFLTNRFSVSSSFRKQWNTIYPWRSRPGIGEIHPNLPGSVRNSCFFISFPCFIAFFNHCLPCTTQRAF